MSAVIWITGLSGAGKTSLAKKLAIELGSRGERSIRLDGDELREVFDFNDELANSYNAESRKRIALSYSRLSRLLAAQNVIVIVSTISLFESVHKWNRSNLPNYLEVYIKVPISELINRDPKGIYGNYFEGKSLNVIGLDVAFDEPVNPDILIEYPSELPGHSSVSKIVELLEKRGIIH